MIDPSTGPFLALLARLRRPRRLLVIGSAHGDKTCSLALGARPHKTEIHIIELHAERAGATADALAQAGLAGAVDIWQGDAREIIPSLEGPFDLALLDAEPEDHEAYFHQLQRKLSHGALLLAAGADTHRAQLGAYLAARAADPRWLTVTLPVGRGIEVSYRLRRERPAIPDPLARLLFILAAASSPNRIRLVGPEAERHRTILSPAVAELGAGAPLLTTPELPASLQGSFALLSPGIPQQDLPTLDSTTTIVLLEPTPNDTLHDTATVPIGDTQLTLIAAHA
ncbi:MAG TPA: class I SAM-dependent methyltransferase [Ardenticatenaceae bacterium]|nr:class I SAM-dependent methyltransferase [Ardenticatenaceae bacterium]